MTPEGINKKAYEKYPVWMDTEYDKYGNAEEIDLNEKARNAYIEAYKEISSLPTIKGWVVRDASGELCYFSRKPFRYKGFWSTGIRHARIMMLADRTLFPNLRYEDEPIEVELPIIRK
ncbi:MAG: hypothetical protein J6Y20_05025 [Lachnospiraceae bacterium]|nr:hypothetical protein [Kiritimatiellia bacterium]MBP5461470.1 hypothetical protein [Lachnospiraceae bacterium]